ncbi:MAG TPA: sensor histidine kinase [Vicinamibacterales bacterium]|nr:sensor histidine kinase [Vicinamibacterales bacterium]
MPEISDGFARKLRAMQTETLDGRSLDRDSRAMPRRDVYVRPRVIFGVATALGFFSGFQAYYYVSTFTEWPASLPFLLALNLGYWYSWAALTPAILYLARKAPFLERSWKSALAIHVPAVFIITLLHVALTVSSQTVIVWIVGQDQRSWMQEAQRMFFNNFDWEMMTYWAIVGLSHALRYQSEAQDRALRASQLETHLVEARLQALQRQLQPHFLFNTLNTISALMHRDINAADNMIAKMSDLLRISLQNVGVQEVPLKQELDFLSKYLEIEQTRFRDRLTVVFDVQPDTLDALVPNLVLQPLVENGIKHGIGPRAAPGQMAISSRRIGSMLELEIKDNGVGLSAARLTDFNRGIGLGNTRSRLQHLYGSSHRFEFRQPPGGGLSVLIAIPLVEISEAVEEITEGVA